MEVKIKYTGNMSVTNIPTETKWLPEEVKKVGQKTADELLKDNKFIVVEDKPTMVMPKRRRGRNKI